MPLANFYPYPGTGPAPSLPGMGAYYSPVGAGATLQPQLGWQLSKNIQPVSGLGGIADSVGSMLSLSSIAWTVLRGAAGWYVGRYFDHPVGGAILGGFFGLPGIFALALFSKTPATAIPNRRRRRRHHRRSRRGGGR